MVTISSITASAQENTADQFLKYLNSYQKEELARMITPDFKFKRKFATKTTDRKEFLYKYLEDSKALRAKFKVIEKPDGKTQNYYVVEDQSQYLKLLDVKFPKWNMTITTVGGKVSEVILAPTEDYDTYVAELNSKGEKFNAWMQERHPKVRLEKLTDLAQVVDYLNEYVQSEGIFLSDLQQYDESAGAPEMVPEIDFADNMTCVHRKQLTEAQRASFYPFNKAKKVVLISFNDKDWELHYRTETPKIIDLSKAASSQQLSKADINRLTDLFYNYGFKKMELVKTMKEKLECSELKNVIVFLDANDKPFEYAAFAFDCDEVEFSSPKVGYGDDCSTKRELVKQFFVSKGIETGK
jgi:hypothetical protein